jgi:hypothetical protein
MSAGELDEMCHLDRLISSLKAEVFRHVAPSGTAA